MDENYFGNVSRHHGELAIQDRNQYAEGLRIDFEQKALRSPKPPPSGKLIEKMRMSYNAYLDIKNTVGSRPAESGGLLISRSKNYEITDFVFDISSARNRTIYQPDTGFLNSFLHGRNDEFVGIVHSHAKGGKRLSQQDQNAAWSNLTSPSNTHLNALFAPLVQTIPDTGRFEIIPYIITCHPEGRGRVIVNKVQLEIID